MWLVMSLFFVVVWFYPNLYDGVFNGVFNPLFLLVVLLLLNTSYVHPLPVIFLFLAAIKN